jgi:peptidoglycan/xylan/chitin deacetylase (PgdA/CDA1 family)
MIKVIYGHDIRSEKPATSFNKNIYTNKKAITNLLENLSNRKCITPRKKNFTSIIKSKDIHFILTFDDAFKSVKTVLLPWIEKHNIPMILFVTTDFIDNKRIAYEIELEEMILNRNEIVDVDGSIYQLNNTHDKETAYKNIRLSIKNKSTEYKDNYLSKLFKINNFQTTNKDFYLSWSDIIELDKHPLITIGAHTLSHPVLTAIKLKDAYIEIKKSKKILETKLKHKILYFSYPYGSNNFYIRKLLQLAGFKYAFTTEEKIIDNSNFNRFKIPRFDINSIT